MQTQFPFGTGVIYGVVTPKTMSELIKPPCINTTGKKKTLNYFPTKKNTFDVLLLKSLV